MEGKELIEFIRINSQFKKIIITGPGASGKDFLKEKLLNFGLTYNLIYTTRPKRNGEIDGKDYIFIDEDTFKFNYFHKFIDVQEFNGWFYGISEDFYNKKFSILVPKTIEKLTKDNRKDYFIIYLDIPEEIRRSRIEKRNDADSVQRRINADKEMFKGFDNYDLLITNPIF